MFLLLFSSVFFGGVGNLRTSEAEVTTGGPDKLRFLVGDGGEATDDSGDNPIKE